MQAPIPPPGRLVRLGVVLPRSPLEARRLARLCDLAGIDAVWAQDEAQAVAVAEVVGRATLAVRPSADEPWARTVAVSIGRTAAEATARAGLDPGFGWDDGGDAVVGTLEDVQAAIAAMAHQGVTDLRCVLPDAPDLPDVVAQLTAAAVGSLATHGPDVTRSPDPPPPPWARPAG